MGNVPVKSEDMKSFQLLTKNKMGKEEIVDYYKVWHRIFPDGNATKDTFHKYVQVAFVDTPVTNCDHLFRAMDVDKSGSVNFQEFLLFQSLTTGGATDQTDMIKLAFNMYDVNGDGNLSVAEMRECLTNILKMQGQNTGLLSVREAITKRVEKIFASADVNGDKNITLQEILDACAKDPSLAANF